VKSAARATSAQQIPDLIAEAWQHALTPPTGPTYVEIPVDILTGQSPVHSLFWREGRSPECHRSGGRCGGHQEFTS